MDEREGGLAAWQWRLYPDGHRDRRNLLVHAITVPLFELGTLALAGAAIAGRSWPAPAGLALVAVALVAQKRGHAVEATAPVPFRGPGDLAARFLVEQWWTFPRYVLSGGFARAWQAAAPRVAP
ncbi:MAG: terminase [Anaeromyxobacter sp.]